MPLMRVFRETVIIPQKANVLFFMAEGVELFRCLVSFSALGSLSGENLTSYHECLKRFRQNRERIVNVGSRLFAVTNTQTATWSFHETPHG
jgi:hypothetical protein